MQFFPYIADSIQAYNLGPLREVKQEYINYLQKNGRVFVVEVYLVRTKSSPQIFLPHGSIESGEQRGFTGPEHLGHFYFIVTHDKIIPVSLITLQKSLEPGRFT
ncbi:hypothetical protein BMS3Bbin07_00258 [bacterium BMS3Bbin07]|nr:hypothetical protein BMS3Bbin07_00258 [bacterium BMS3Bbin07]